MTLFQKTLRNILIVVAVGALFCVFFLAFEKIEWQRLATMGNSAVISGLLLLLSVPLLWRGLQHKTENFSRLAEEAVRWLLFGMMCLLFLGVLACVSHNFGAVFVTLFFVVLSFLMMKVLMGRTYDQSGGRWYNLQNFEVIWFAQFLIILSMMCVSNFSSHDALKGYTGIYTCLIAISTFAGNFRQNKL